MGRVSRRHGRKRIGRVSYYFRRGAWHIYYRDGGRQVRRRVGQSQEEASQVAAQVNAQLACSIPTPFSFTPLGVPELRQRFLDHHEYVLRSSLATVRRYRAATLKWTPKTGQPDKMFSRPVPGRSGGPFDEQEASAVRGVFQGPGGFGGWLRRASGLYCARSDADGMAHNGTPHANEPAAFG